MTASVIDLTSDDEDSLPLVKSTASAQPRQSAQNDISAPSTNGNTCITPAVRDRALSTKHGKLSRHFWSAGDYESSFSSVSTQGGMDHVRVHPKFLHSNATSHKWALGAIAELLDNALDEVQNGASAVEVDKIMNPRDKSPALLVQDDGGGMDPENMRQCMSLGYSRKSLNSIGQYGNGFKTSTMRLGADVIVFSRCVRNSVPTQSIGLLSYTFLRETGHEDIIVPMVDYELPSDVNVPKRLVRTNKDDWLHNLTTILGWSPYATEAELLKQFNNIGSHGTKVIVYNLWLNDDGVLELDFDTDQEDIQLRCGGKQDKGSDRQSALYQNHISHALRYSLRAYTSILYLRMAPNFQIRLRGKVVAHHSIGADLKFPEHIIYKPQIGGNTRDLAYKEVSVVTTIGFTKEAPMINVHGFNVYHKNRLIMPFWKVLHENSSRGRGVVGVLEANFIEPAHDKQDFEKTSLLMRLETRLKQMTIEYWNLHCEMIGYHPAYKSKAQSNPTGPVSGNGFQSQHASPSMPPDNTNAMPGSSSLTLAISPSTPPQEGVSNMVVAEYPGRQGVVSPSNGLVVKQERTEEGGLKRKADLLQDPEGCLPCKRQHQAGESEFQKLMEENAQLRMRCTELELKNTECEKKLNKVENELLETKNKYIKVLKEMEERSQQPLKKVKEERW